MGILESAIVTVCMGASGNYRPACTNALDAGSKQSGIAQEINSAEQNSVRMADKAVTDKIGEKTKAWIGGTLFLVKTVQDKSVSFPLPTGGLADEASSSIKPDSTTISIGWKF